MPARRTSRLLPALAFAAPFLIHACTLPEYVYDDDAFGRAQGLAGSGNAGGEAGAPQAGASGEGGTGGVSGNSGQGGGGKSPAGQGGSGGSGGSVSEGGSGGATSTGGDGGSDAGHTNGGESGSSGQGGSSSGAGQGGAGGSGQAGAGNAGAGNAGSGQGGSAQGGAGQGGAGQGGAGQGGAGQGGSGPSECVLRAFDFTGCSQEFTSTGNKNPWECGKPTTGPGADHSGGGTLWATRIGAKPAECEDSFLVSPVIDLSSHAGKPVKIRVWHWAEFRVCDPTKGLFGACQIACSPPFGLPVDSYSGGVLEVFSGGAWKTVLPGEGYGASDQIISANGGSGDPKDGGTPPCQDSSLDGKKGFAAKGVNKQWVLSTFDVSSYTTADFQFRLHFASAPKEECFPNTAGWYVDDIAVFYAGACK